MSYHLGFTPRNEKYAASFDKGDLPLPPSKHVAILACMDARIEPASQLGINLREAHVIRNGGGRAQDALRNIVISQRLLGTREIAVFHHTDCGMLTFTNEGIRDQVKSEEPGNAEVASLVDHIDFLPSTNVEQSVHEDIKFLKEHPLLVKGTVITGWTYDVKTGKVRQIV